MTQDASPVAAGGPNTLDVSIILPVFNEVEHLKQEVERVRTAMNASNYTYEIIIVDDGSSDGSGELALTIPDVRVIRFLQNRGSGSAPSGSTSSQRRTITGCRLRVPPTAAAASGAGIVPPRPEVGRHTPRAHRFRACIGRP